MFVARSKFVFWLVSFGTCLTLLPGGARADVFDDAWECAESAVDGIALTASVGARALKFVATKPDCVARMGAPATIAPIGVVVALCATGVLPESQPSCGGAIYGVAARPIAGALGNALGELGILKDESAAQLSKIAAGHVSGELLANVPGIDTVTGSLTCGCDLVAAGLSIETIEEVLNTADRVADACGGPVWDAAKEAAREVVNFAGDAAEEGIRQVSNLGDAIAGQSKHIDLQTYFDQNWAPHVEDFASVEFSSPGAWHDNKKWKELWNPCVAYFDSHTMSAANAQASCDDMRSGTSRENGLFAGRGFSQRMFRRVFEFDVAGQVEAARTKARTDYTDLQVDVPVPQDVVDDVDAATISAKVEARWTAERLTANHAAVDEVFGIAQKEKKHNGLQTSTQTPPALWIDGTVGARAFDFYDQVKAPEGNGRANAGEAVQLAMQDIDAPVRSKVVEAKLRLYGQELNSARLVREVNRDLDQEKVDRLIGACSSQDCKDTVANEFVACREQTQAWYAENESTIANFDSSEGKAATREWESRRAACVKQANDTLRDTRISVQGGTPLPVRVPPGIPTTGGLNERQGGRRDKVDGSDEDRRGREAVQERDVRNNLRVPRRDSVDSLRKDQSADDVARDIAPESFDSAPEPERETLKVLEPVAGAPGSEPVRVPNGGSLRLRTPLSVAPDEAPTAEPGREADADVEAEADAIDDAEAEAEAEAATEAEAHAEATREPEPEPDTTEVLEPVMGAPGTEPVQVQGGMTRRLRAPLSVAPDGEVEAEAEKEADAASEREPETEPEA